jgi:methyl-accepting chemotaxis protein
MNQEETYKFNHKVIIVVGIVAVTLMLYFAINMYQMVNYVGKIVKNTNVMTEQMLIVGKSMQDMSKNMELMNKNTLIMGQNMQGLNNNLALMNSQMTKDITSMSTSMNKMNKNITSMDKGMKNITTPAGFMKMWRK